MRSAAVVTLGAMALAAASGCGLVIDLWPGEGEVPPPADAGLDARTTDGEAPPSADAGLDARTADGGSGGSDGATPPDAEAVDAAADDDGGPALDAGSCGTLGQPCTTSDVCDPGQACNVDLGFCMPSHGTTCDGFVAAPCPPEYTHCPHCSGCDHGYCLYDEEYRCLCDSPASSSFMPCTTS